MIRIEFERNIFQVSIQSFQFGEENFYRKARHFLEFTQNPENREKIVYKKNGNKIKLG